MAKFTITEIKRYVLTFVSHLAYTPQLDVLKGIMLDIYKAEKLVKESKEYSFCVFTPKRKYPL